MERRFFKSVLPVEELPQQNDTSLVLPTEPTPKSSTRAESAEKNLRVQKQVQLTLEKKTKKGGVKLQGMTSRSLNEAYEIYSHTKKNRADFSSLSLKVNHVQRLPKRMSMSPTPSNDVSQWNFSSAYAHGTSSPSRPGNFQAVEALMDWTDGPNSAELHTFSETLQGSATHAAMSQPGIYRSKLLWGSFEENYPSESWMVKQSPNNSWIHRQSGFKHDKPTVQQSLYERQISSPPLIMNKTLDIFGEEEAEMDGAHYFKIPIEKHPEMTMFKALKYLDLDDGEMLVCATKYIQAKCVDDENNRETVFNLGGVAKLLKLLQNDSEEVQRAAAGALRNAVYNHNHNKADVMEKDGLVIILQALVNTRDKETIWELAGLLWNLSSVDAIKKLFNENSLNIITKSVLVPSSGINAAENPKDEMIAHPKAFQCATGCLRNLSSANPNIRESMRKCENLIDSLVYYIQGALARRETNDDSTENCVCILQNLTFKAEDDLSFPTNIHLKASETNTAPSNTIIGCFPHCSPKIQKEEWDFPDVEYVHVLLEDKDPHGAGWLWNNAIVQMYLHLLGCSKRSLTLQAAIGALQNLTAGKGVISESIACSIVEKGNGLQRIKKVLADNNSLLKKPAISLAENLSCFPKIQPEIFSVLLPEILKTLQSPHTDKVAVLRILRNLSRTNVKHFQTIIGLREVQRLLRSERQGEAEEVVNDLLKVLWSQKVLQRHLKQLGIRKPKES